MSGENDEMVAVSLQEPSQMGSQTAGTACDANSLPCQFPFLNKRLGLLAELFELHRHLLTEVCTPCSHLSLIAFIICGESYHRSGAAKLQA